MVIGTVMAFHAIGINQTTNHILVAGLVTVLSYLMISRVRFRSMKDLKLTKRTTAVVGLLIASAVVVAVRISRPAVLILLVGCYITLCVIEQMILLRKGRLERLRAARAQALAPTPVDDVDNESDVLAELGVDDDVAAPDPEGAVSSA